MRELCGASTADINYRTKKGMTALHYGMMKRVLFLLISLNLVQNNFKIAFMGSKEVVIKELVSRGARFDYKDKNGNTPLDLAIHQSDYRTVKYLIDNNIVSVNQKATNCWTFLHNGEAIN